MSEPRYVSPLLDGFSLGQSISEHSGVACYPAMRDDSEKRYIVKKISLPASQVQVEALLLTGVFRDAEAVRAYYEELAQGVRKEVQTLETLAGQRGFVPYNAHQIEPMEEGVGYDVILLGRYRKTLDRFMERNPMTHLSAVNLGIDMCAALAVCREAGWLYVDLKPQNIHMFEDQEYRIGDLGFMPMDMLAYSSLPERYRSLYTAPEVADAYSTLNTTMDTYAVGLILYQVFNQGKLPFSSAEERAEWAQRLSDGEAMTPPVCADEEMASIIAKACAIDPADRWQTPAELGHALISYMQRNGAEDIPLVLPEPQPEEAPDVEQPVEESPAEEPAEEAVVEEAPAEEPAEAPDVEESTTEEPAEAPDVEESPAEEPIEEPVIPEAPAEVSAEEPVVEQTADEAPTEEPPVEDIPAEAASDEPEMEQTPEEAPAEEPVTEELPKVDEETTTADWIDLMDAFLAEEENTPVPAEDEPTLRELLGDEEEYLTDAEELSEEDVSAETADFLSFAQELIEHEAPTPVMPPEPIDLPIPEPLVPLGEEEDEVIDLLIPEEDEEDDEGEAETPVPPAPAPLDEAPKSGIFKKLLGAVAALAVVTGLGFGAWYYYQNIYLQPIRDLSYTGSGREVTITVDTPMDHSQLTVICKDTYGNAVTGKLENGQATFSDLVPGSQYIISLEPEGFHKLTGSTSVTYSTPAETQLMHLTAVTGQEAGSVIISFGVEGTDSEEWTVVCTAEGLEPQSISFTGHTVTISDLTVGTEYTFTLSAPENILLVGETAIAHTASELVQASDVALAGYENGVLSVSWTAPEGVDHWIVRCFDGAGYDQLQEVTGNTAAFEGVTEGTKYTVEVTAASQTLAVRSEMYAKASSISGFTAQLSGSNVELSWNSTDGGPWTIECMADGNVLQVITAEENKAAFGPVAPGTVYTFSIQSAAVSAASPAPTATVETPAAGTFSANKLDSETIIVEMFDVPDKSGWNYGTLLRAKEKDTFKAGGSMALLYTVTKPYSFDSAAFETVFVIRDADGKLVSTSGQTRSWNDMWDNGYCTERVTNLPAAEGSYTLSIYINNGLLAQLPFTVK